jgi:hypothetical protein
VNRFIIIYICTFFIVQWTNMAYVMATSQATSSKTTFSSSSKLKTHTTPTSDSMYRSNTRDNNYDMNRDSTGQTAPLVSPNDPTVPLSAAPNTTHLFDDLFNQTENANNNTNQTCCSVSFVQSVWMELLTILCSLISKAMEMFRSMCSMTSDILHPV